MSAIKTLGRLPASAFGALEIERLPEAVLAGYRALGDLTGTTSDAMDYCGVSGAVPGSSLRPSDPVARVVAQAVTVLNRKLDKTVPEAVARNVSHLAEIEAHNLAAPGDILVIQGVANISSMGGISASIGKRQGEAGAVVDGAVRDIDHSRKIGYPVWSSSVSPATGKWRIETVGINVPVVMAGVTVHPGDLVIADEVGVCFVPRARAVEVLATAQRLEQAEEERLAKIGEGMPLAQFLALPRKK